MNRGCIGIFSIFLVVFAFLGTASSDVLRCCKQESRDFKDASSWQGSWSIFPTVATWSLQTRIPMTTEFEDSARQERGKFKTKRKLKKFLFPLLLAYKLKFFTLIPVLIGGLVLLTGATGLAGFFFALFAAVMGLKSGNGHGRLSNIQ